MDGGTIAEWVGIGISALIGGTALIRAGKANSIAAGEAQTAKTALNEAKRSNRTAEEANGIAKNAAESANAATAEARRSADIAERVENRQVERNDVNWSLPKDFVKGTWTATNKGIDTAFEAYVVLDVEGHRIVSESTDVAGAEHLKVDISEIYRAKVAKNQAATARMRERGVGYYGSSSLKPAYQIHWRTKNGVWHTRTADG